jgi:hypothetical protein
MRGIFELFTLVIIYFPVIFLKLFPLFHVTFLLVHLRKASFSFHQRPKVLSPEKIDDLNIIFNTYDKDNSGTISRTELKSALRSLHLSKGNLENLVTKLDVDGGS